MNVKIKQTGVYALVPKYATDGSGCFDLFAANGATIFPNNHKPVGTGLAFEIPEDHVMLVFARSGNAAKYKVNLMNSVGVIDSDYRGEVMVMLQNKGHFDFEVRRGDRIAQAMIVPVQKVVFEKVDELSDTTRGENGFGSTGK